eukprot:gnl/TRDRNA2_/TRDRNA2_144919_c0_seq1.p1 gnl/TRDRNA2_/TRDRNA2_144919_c0~~gnl/TRDRNA2_/TRDRNA2_144919_c0_seq1.p1  ORF type:complete len:625 (+),score=101.50 gnl/TRDRNA2_/TRDRNA2_144919_c0_seq1:37-1911(+)
MKVAPPLDDVRRAGRWQKGPSSPKQSRQNQHGRPVPSRQRAGSGGWGAGWAANTQQAPPRLSIDSVLEGCDKNQLERDLRAKLQECEPTAEDDALQAACIKSLEEMVKTLGEEWRVKAFGSAANGFGTRGSDLDISCFQEGIDTEDTAYTSSVLREKLRPLLYQHNRFEIVEEILSARIPILKLRFDGSLDVDLSCHNIQPLRNTRLLQAYAKLDPVVRQLVVAIKLWAKAEHVSGAPDGNLSSYSLTLLALYFLQVDPDLQMPRLNTKIFGEEDFEGRRQIVWSCRLPLADVVCRFFHFYAVEFDWGAEVVSVRLGRRASTEGFPKLKARSVQRFHVEDPYLLEKNLNYVLGAQQETILQMKLLQACDFLSCGESPNGFASLSPASVSQARRNLQLADMLADHAVMPQAKESAAPWGTPTAAQQDEHWPMKKFDSEAQSSHEFYKADLKDLDGATAPKLEGDDEREHEVPRWLSTHTRALNARSDRAVDEQDSWSYVQRSNATVGEPYFGISEKSFSSEGELSGTRYESASRSSASVSGSSEVWEKESLVARNLSAALQGRRVDQELTMCASMRWLGGPEESNIPEEETPRMMSGDSTAKTWLGVSTEAPSANSVPLPKLGFR